MEGVVAVTRNLAREVNRATKGLSLWWLGNAGVALRYGEILIFIDPVVEVKGEDDQTFSETGLRLRHKLPLRATEVELQWDELGLGLIVYPVQGRIK